MSPDDIAVDHEFLAAKRQGAYSWPTEAAIDAALARFEAPLGQAVVLDDHFTDRLWGFASPWPPLEHDYVRRRFDATLGSLLNDRLQFAGAMGADLQGLTEFITDLVRAVKEGRIRPARAEAAFLKYCKIAGLRLSGLRSLAPAGGLYLQLADMVGNCYETGQSTAFNATRRNASQHEAILKQLNDPMLLVDLYPHQEEALAAWKAAQARGIVAMATATGKTILGLAAIEHAFRRWPQPRILVVAPSRAILRQWEDQVREKMDVTAADIIPTESISHGGLAFQTVQGLLRRQGNPIACDLLIVDEAHHFAAPEFRKAITAIQAPWRLALSATIEGSKEEFLAKAIGDIAFTLTVKDALARNLLPSFLWSVYVTPMEALEAERFKAIGKDIADTYQTARRDMPAHLRAKFGELRSIAHLFSILERLRYGGDAESAPASWKRLHQLVVARRWIVHRSRPKIDDAVELAAALGRTRKVLVFTMDIATAKEIAHRLRRHGLAAHEAHSDQREADQAASLRAFKAGTSGVLVSPKLLDEGVDIPDADVGINVASSKTRIQLVQRLGRILRPHPGKKPEFHHFMSVVATDGAVPDLDDPELVTDLNWVRDLSNIFGIEPTFTRLESSLSTAELHQREGHGAKVWQDLLRSGEASVPAYTGHVNPEKLLRDLEPEQAATLVGLWQRLALPQAGAVSITAWQTFVREARKEVPLNGWWWIHTIYGSDPHRLYALLASRAAKASLQPPKLAIVQTRNAPATSSAVPPPGRAERRQTFTVPATPSKRPAPLPMQVTADDPPAPKPAPATAGTLLARLRKMFRGRTK